MIFLASLLFRVIQPENLNSFYRNKLKIKSNEIGCDVTQDKIKFEHKLGVDEYVYCGPKNGANVGEFKIEKCLFQNIWGAGKKGNKIIGCENHDFFLNENTFTGCTAYENIIHCFPKEDKNNNFYFKMYSNTFSDCHHPDENTKSVMIKTHYKNNDIQMNTISYLRKENSQRAFEIDYYKDCKMIGNTISNAFHTDSSAIKFIEPGSGTNDLEIKDCIFSNCQGDNKSNGHKGGLAIIIEHLNSPLNIINTTFKNLKPDLVEESKDTAYFVRVETDQNTPLPVTFSYCTFSYIETCAKSGGGIGFCYKNTALKTLTFEYTKFEHLFNYYTSSEIGGGALSIDTSFDEIKKTDLYIVECSFYNVSSSYNGGAIYFNSDNTKLSIKSSNFSNTKTKNDQTFGGAIYIVRNENYNSEISIENCKFTKTLAIDSGHSIMIEKSFNEQVSIISCDFVDCGENQISYTAVFDVSLLNFQKNNIIFSDSTKNCGCIELRKILEHTIKGNIFCNACINNDLIWNSAGIHYDSWDNLNSIVIEDNVFDSILGNNEGRCIFIASREAELSINNNTIKNCPSGGTLVKIWFRSRKYSFKIEQFKLLNNTMNDFRDQSLGCTPHFWFENTMEQDQNHIDPIEVTFENCNFQSNSNPTQGGGLRFGANHYFANIKIILNHCNFTENDAENEGGAVYLQTYQGCKLDDCYFIRNKSNQGCGAIFIETEFECINNNIPGETFPPPSADSRNPEISINNCHFENNNGKDSHGIYISDSTNALVQIFKCEFNDCGENGYVVSIQSKVKSIQINNCSIVFSIGEKSASGVFSVTDKIVFIGNTFDNCNKNTIQIEGILNEHNEIQFVENNFINCHKGTIINVLNLFTTKPTFIGNTFKYVSLSSPILNMKIQDSIDSVDFINNTFCHFHATSDDVGGNGIEINHESNDKEIYISYTNCYFINNTNKQKGGAIHCEASQNNGNIYLTLSECFFEQNNNEMNGGAIYINIKHDITIQKCCFNNNSAIKGGSIYIQPDFNDFVEQSNIKISECNFEQNGANDCSSIYISSGSSKTLNIDTCTFEDEIGGVAIDDFNNKIEVNNNQFIRTSNNPALILTQTQELKNEIYIDFCTFDSCYGPLNKCFNIEIFTYNFYFRNSIIKNMIGTGSNSYFGSISYKSKNVLSLNNISFINNSGNSLYGGGIAIRFESVIQLNMFKCNFTNNQAKQCTDVSRPKQESTQDYFNGDGGAIKLGYICQMNDMNVLFSDCYFANNKAHRHGGALALQTYTIVRIEKCVFENNYANANDLDAELLYDNHFDKKTKGRGGAIYINPSYSYDDKTGQCNTQSIHMTNVQISDCNFIKNNAYDGYAIYIEGDDPGTEFIIKSNDFIDNYNEKNYVNDNNIIYGAVITTEICSIIEKDIIDQNNFSYNNDNLLVKELSCVDHFGNTETNKFTESNGFTNSNVFSSCYFSNSQYFTVSNEFSKSYAFSETNKFTETAAFSESNQFTKSEQFIKTDAFSKSDQFSKSEQFVKTEAFSKSNLFTLSNDFSKSQVFTPTSSINKPLNPIDTGTSFSFSENSEELSNSSENSEEVSNSSENSEEVFNSLGNSEEVSNSFENSEELSNSFVVSSSNEISNSLNDESKISFSTKNENDYTRAKTEITHGIASTTNLIHDTGAPENKTGKKSNSLPLIIGVAIGIVALIAIIIVIVIIVIKRKRSGGRISKNENENEMMDSTNNFIQSYASEDFENPLYNDFGLNNKDLFNEAIDESEV